MKVLYFKAQNMLSRNLFMAKLLFQIGIAIAGNINPKEQKNVSKNWHKTQVFIYYNKQHFVNYQMDCLGTILSTRFILTAATCILNSEVRLKEVIILTVYDSYEIEKYTIHPDFLPDSITPDLAVVKLTKDIKSKDLIFTKKVAHLYPQDRPSKMICFNFLKTK